MTRISIKKYLSWFFLLALLLVSPTIFAADEFQTPENLKSVGGIINILNQVVSILYQVFFIVAVGAILWAAFTYLRAGQDTKMVDQAKTQLKYAVIAIVVALVAGGVSLIIKSFIESAS